MVEVWWQNFKVHGPTFPNQQADFIGIVALNGEQSGHVLYRIVGFKVSRLACHQAIVCRVGMIKAIPCEILNIVPNTFTDLASDALFFCAVDEFNAVFVNFRLYFLTNGLTNLVSVARAVTCQVAGNTN